MINDNQQQIPQGPPPKVQVSASAVAAKYRSKRELWNFLSVDCGAYVPPYGKWRLAIYGIFIDVLINCLYPQKTSPSGFSKT